MLFELINIGMFIIIHNAHVRLFNEVMHIHKSDDERRKFASLCLPDGHPWSLLMVDLWVILYIVQTIMSSRPIALIMRFAVLAVYNAM